MCLGIPMKIVEINGNLAQCEANGVMRDVNLFMLYNEQVDTGDYVMVHVGYAIQKITPQEARSSWELFDQILNTNSRKDLI